MKTKFLFLAALLFFSSYCFGQLKVGVDGEVIIGPPAWYGAPGHSEYDNDGSIHQIYGPYGEYGAGSVLSFGDFLLNYPIHNVMIGEYTNEDTDKLWLHGKMGVYITYKNHTANDIVAYYDPSRGNYFQFNQEVRSTGVFVSSDSAFKENILPLKNTYEKLKELKPVSYKLKNNLSETNSELKSGKIHTNEKAARQEEFFAKFEESLQNRSRKFGFIAQDVEKIFPELVQKDDSTGYMYIDYIGMIPLIINALNEQEVEKEYVEYLEKRIEDLENIVKNKAINSELNIANKTNNIESVVYPNRPNPFKEETSISYVIAETVKSAVLYIYDMQGKQIKNHFIDERGNGSIVIKGTELPAGMYIYTIIADGKEIGTHRMILTK